MSSFTRVVLLLFCMSFFLQSHLTFPSSPLSHFPVMYHIYSTTCYNYVTSIVVLPRPILEATNYIIQNFTMPTQLQQHTLTHTHKRRHTNTHREHRLCYLEISV